MELRRQRKDLGGEGRRTSRPADGARLLGLAHRDVVWERDERAWGAVAPVGKQRVCHFVRRRLQNLMTRTRKTPSVCPSERTALRARAFGGSPWARRRRPHRRRAGAPRPRAAQINRPLLLLIGRTVLLAVKTNSETERRRTLGKRWSELRGASDGSESFRAGGAGGGSGSGGSGSGDPARVPRLRARREPALPTAIARSPRSGRWRGRWSGRWRGGRWRGGAPPPPGRR